MFIDARQTLILAILTLFLGKFLNQRITFLRTYNIPEPVTGGVLVSVLFFIVYTATGTEVQFDLSGRDTLLIIFFTTVGLNAKLGTLIAGGKPLLILLACAVGFLLFQNLTGIAVAYLFGENLLAGLLGGTVSLSGGHGTAIAWAPIFREQYGIESAMTIGIAVATCGLILGGVIGGPIAQYLIKKYKLVPDVSEQEYLVGLPDEKSKVRQEDPKVNTYWHTINVDTILSCLITIALAIGLGQILSDLAADIGLKLPVFVGALFAGILFTNILPPFFKKMPWPSGSTSLALISDVSLSLFLAMSLMSLQLWSILVLAGPIVVLLIAQVIAITAWSIFVIFRLMGKTYDAAVMSAGYAGLGLGATPTAVANMTAVTKKCGASPLAFLIVPLIGAFFIDIANAFIIKFFITMLV